MDVCGVVGLHGMRVQGFAGLVETLLWEIQGISTVSQVQLLPEDGQGVTVVQCGGELTVGIANCGFVEAEALELPLNEAGRDLTALCSRLNALVEDVDGEVGVSQDGEDLVDSVRAHLAADSGEGDGHGLHEDVLFGVRGLVGCGGWG